MDASNGLFTTYISDYAASMSGLHSSTWSSCSVSNATYTACPVKTSDTSFAITSYNPSAIDVDLLTFKVPPPAGGQYDVELYDRGWKNVNSTVLCYDFLENNAEHSSYPDCNLHVGATIKPHQMTFLKAHAAQRKATPAAQNETTISTSKASLTYNGQSEADASVFTYKDNLSGKTYRFSFNM